MPGPATLPRNFDRFWPTLLILLGGLAAYSGSLTGPFVFDDPGSIIDNLTLRHLWPLGAVLAPPPGGLTVSGRPFLNLTFALNYAWGGTDVRGYHVVNIAIHLLAGLTLFGLVRRTLAQSRSSTLIACSIALLWTVHPLQTESVTYVVQRAESLMGLCYFLTLYCFSRFVEGETLARSATDARRGAGTRQCFEAWAAASVIVCLFGMATKEVMVSAPVIVFLYDRTFVAGSFREAWRKRRAFHLCLASTWILLACLVIGGGGGRGGSVGFGAGVSWWAYGLTQFEAICRYLRLSVWPHPLVFEYGTFWVKDAWSVVPFAVVVVSLAAATAIALKRWPVWGFLGFWFFAILAPTSLVPGTTQMIVEHRMYLALAAVLTALICGGWTALNWGIGRRAATAALPLVIACAAACVLLTAYRNRAYRSALDLWSDTVAKRPENALAHNNRGIELRKVPGRLPEAIAEYQEALRLDPDFYEAHNNLGNVWLDTPGKLDDAIAEYQRALRLHHDFAEAHNDLGDAFSRIPGRTSDAITQYAEAVRLKPNYAGAHYNLGKAWLSVPGKIDAAIAEFETTVHLNPEFAEARNNLGNAWMGVPGKQADALAQIQEALRLKPDFAEAHNNLGNILLETPGRLDDAIAQYKEALRLKPDYAEAHYNLAVALLHLPDRIAEARIQLATFLKLRPDNEEAREVLSKLPPQEP